MIWIDTVADGGCHPTVIKNEVHAMAPAIDFREFARSVGTLVRYGSGDVIFREGDTAGLMYIILGGSVEISRDTRTIEVIDTGHAFGFVSLLDGRQRTVSACASKDCELALIDAKKFRYMMEEMPNFVWYVVGEMGERLRTASLAI
jgi:CRP-like cAMP-binding protein